MISYRASHEALTGQRKKGRSYPSHLLPGINYSLARSNLLYFLTLFCSPAQTSFNGYNQRFFQLERSRTRSPLSLVLHCQGHPAEADPWQPGCATHKHYPETANWERGDYNQAKGISTSCLRGFCSLPIPMWGRWATSIVHRGAKQEGANLQVVSTCVLSLESGSN